MKFSFGNCRTWYVSCFMKPPDEREKRQFALDTHFHNEEAEMMRRIVVASIVFLGAFWGGEGSLAEPTDDPLWIIENPALAAYDNFGYSVAGVGDNVLVGAPYYDDREATDAGAAYLFSTDGALLQTFQNPNPTAYDRFGWSVAGVGDNVLIGVPYDVEDGFYAGAAYLLDGATGALLQTFQNPNPPADDYFGWSVAGVGDNILVGAPGDDTGGFYAGAVHLFDGATGALIQTFRKTTPAAYDNFGWSVAGVGDNVLIGVRYDDTGGTNAGATYLFRTDGALLQTFENPAPDPYGGDNFGWSVAGVGDNVLIGAPYDDTGGTDVGVAYLFDGATGALLQAFQKTTPAAFDNFGYSVAAVGGNVLVGVPYDDTGGTNVGAAYLFDGTDGALLHTFENPTPDPNGRDSFGYSVAAVGNNVLVGAPYDDTGGTDVGAAYLFRRANRPPELSSLDNCEMDEGGELEVGISADDPDGTTPTLSASNLPAFARLTDNGDGTGVLHLTPDFIHAGTYPDVVITATDAEDASLTDSETIEISVNNVSLDVAIDLHPKTLQLSSTRKSITCKVFFPQDLAKWPEQVDVGTVQIDEIDGRAIEPIPAQLHPTSVEEGRLMVKFDHQSVIDRLAAEGVVPPTAVSVTISGTFLSSDQRDFAGTDEVQVKGSTSKAIKVALKGANPFNPSTMIEYTLSENMRVRLEIYNQVGQRVAVLVDGAQPAGSHSVRWDAAGYSSGVYFYRFHAGDVVRTGRMTLTK